MRRSIAAVAFLSMLPGLALAQSLKERKAMADAESSLATDGVKPLNDACGTAIKVTIDWPSFKGNFKDSNDEPVARNYCESVLSSIASMCGDNDAKTAIAKDVKTVKCSFDKSVEKHKLKVDLKGGALRAGF